MDINRLPSSINVQVPVFFRHHIDHIPVGQVTTLGVMCMDMSGMHSGPRRANFMMYDLVVSINSSKIYSVVHPK